MSSEPRMLPAIVAAAVALIAITNYAEIRLLAGSNAAGQDLLPHLLSFGLPTSVAVILVLSILYHAHQETLWQVRQHADELLLKSQRDKLTGLANREYFEGQLADAVARFGNDGETFALLLLDLDHFKRVNDLHGHQTGDTLLQEVSSKLTERLGEEDVVARLGGDEFVILRKKINAPEEVEILCQSVCKGLESPYDIGKLHLTNPASVGAVCANDQFKTPSDYLRAADMALYDAKAKGRSCYRFYSDELDERLRRRDRLETDLRKALRNKQGVDVFYQPQIDSCGQLTGVEALFRWTHPELGYVQPLEAVEIAEESNLILLLGEFVFREVASFARRHPTLSVAMNVSPAQFDRAGDFAGLMTRLAREEGLRPAQMELEITERLFVEIGSETEMQIQALRDVGFRVALDDFGTGYSSLNYLRRFQIDRLKLDRSFVDQSQLHESIAIIRASVGLAHMLGLDVVAEGVETREQEAVVLESGCDALQGNYYSQPMPAHDFDAFVRARSRRVA